MKWYVGFIAAFLFSACSTTYPAVTEYKINVDTNNRQQIVSSCKNESLKVAQVFVSAPLMQKEMHYVVGKYQEGTFNQSAWAQSPNRALTDAIVQRVQKEHIFATVESYKSFSSAKYTLESSVHEFTQYFSEDEKVSHAVVDISFTLIDNATAKIVSTKEILKMKTTKEATAKSGVEALNELLTQTLRELSSWLAGSCR